MFEFLRKQFGTLSRTRRDTSGQRGHRAHRDTGARSRPRLETLEQRLAPYVYHWFAGTGHTFWSEHENWIDTDGEYNGPPYGDPHAALFFRQDFQLNPEHDSTYPTTIDSIEFDQGGYSLSARPGASVITLAQDIVSNTRGGNKYHQPSIGFRFQQAARFQYSWKRHPRPERPPQWRQHP